MVALEDLLVDASDLDRELVATTLAPVVRLDRATGDIVLLLPWYRLPADARVLLYLLARRAAAALELPGSHGRPIAPAGLVRATGIPAGTVRPALKKLLGVGLVRKEGLGYLVPISGIVRAREYVRPWVAGGEG